MPLRTDLASNEKLIPLVMNEYSAIRNELDTSLLAQNSILSFGAATAGLLVAAAGSLWQSAPMFSAILLIAVVPTACFLTLTMHAGETVRLMRAGLFLNRLENNINCAFSPKNSTAGILIWEQWGVRDGQVDMARRNRRAITIVFCLLAFGFMVAGCWRLYDLDMVSGFVAFMTFGVVAAIGIYASLSVGQLYGYAYKFRSEYIRTAFPKPD